MPATPTAAPQLAAFLRGSGERCIEAWVEWVRRTPRGATMHREAIRDNHPALLEAMTDLAEGSADAAKRIREAARAHAGQRASHGYRLEELLHENAAFRRIVLHRIDEEGIRLDLAEKKILHESLDEAAVESARYFTERERDREQSLLQGARDAQATLEEILDRITEGFFAVDSDHRFTFLNHAGERMLGASFADVRGKRIWEAFPGAESSSMVRAYREALETGRPVDRTFPYEPWGRFFDVRAFPSPTGLSVYFRDRTDHIVHERERERILEIVEYGDPVVVTDADFRVIFVNTSEEQIMQRPRSESLGRNLWELAPDAADRKRRFWREFHRVMDERVPVQFEEFYERRAMWLGVTAYPTREGGMAIFYRDISDRKREEALQERLLGVVGHDLRNPLTAVRLGVRRVANRTDVPLPARLTLERSLRAVDRMQRMITALLDYSRMHAGGFAIARHPVDASELLEEVILEFEESHPGRIELSCEGDLRGAWDPDRVAQVFSNLIANALRHGDPAAPVQVRAREDGDALRVEVHNDGPPIPPEVRRTLFEPFQRHTQGGGLGLGLYISCNVVTRHGGSIDVDSRAGHGTTFTVTLPRSAP